MRKHAIAIGGLVVGTATVFAALACDFRGNESARKTVAALPPMKSSLEDHRHEIDPRIKYPQQRTDDSRANGVAESTAAPESDMAATRPTVNLSAENVHHVGFERSTPALGDPAAHRPVSHDISQATADELVDIAAHNCGGAGEMTAQQISAVVAAYSEFLDRFASDKRRENVLYDLVDVLVRAKRFDGAREAASTWGPKIGLPDWRVDRYLCDSYLTQRDLPKVREYAEKILQTAGVPREARAEAAFSIAYSWFLDRDFDKAGSLYARLVDDYAETGDPKLQKVVMGARGQMARIKRDGK